MADTLLTIDGGGTKTSAAMCDRHGNIVAFAEGAGCNPQDNPHWENNLTGVIKAIASQAGAPAFSVIGMPGYSEIPVIDEQIQGFLDENLSGPREVLNDVELAYHSAFPSGGGVLLLAGTGSMAMKIDPGSRVRVGGWGHVLGDEGSAHWVGLHALQHLTQVVDGRAAACTFSIGLARHLGVSIENANTDLLGWLGARTHPRSDIAGLSKVVDELANSGAPKAVQLLESAAAALANLVKTAHGESAEPLAWAQAGSMFESRTIQDETTRLLDSPASAPAFSILQGGLWRAAHKAGWAPDERFAHTLKIIKKDGL